MPLFYKRVSFSHEKEVRVACFENENESSQGVTWHVDLDKLVHEIVACPLVEDWMFGIVEETTRRFNESLAKKTRRSDIARSTTLEMLLRRWRDRRVRNYSGLLRFDGLRLAHRRQQMMQQPIPAARSNRLTKWPGPGLAPAFHRRTKRALTFRGRASPRQVSPAACRKRSSRSGKS